MPHTKCSALRFVFLSLSANRQDQVSTGMSSQQTCVLFPHEPSPVISFATEELVSQWENPQQTPGTNFLSLFCTSDKKKPKFSRVCKCHSTPHWCWQSPDSLHTMSLLNDTKKIDLSINFIRNKSFESWKRGVILPSTSSYTTFKITKEFVVWLVTFITTKFPRGSADRNVYLSPERHFPSRSTLTAFSITFYEFS